MSQTNSPYARLDRDHYRTPAWCTRLVMRHLPARIERVFECACGDGAMSNVLAERYDVFASDIHFHSGVTRSSLDFLKADHPAQCIATNPPYAIAQEFVEHALKLTESSRGVVAMLLSDRWDAAGSRQHLTGRCPQFAKRIAMIDRITWLPRPDGSEAPSENHCWFVWDWTHEGPPVVAYDGATEIERAEIAADKAARRKRWREVFGPVKYDPAIHDDQLMRLAA